MNYFVFIICLLLSGCGDYRVGKNKKTVPIGANPNNLICPAGYSLVPAHALNNDDEFCVMKFEARNDGSGNPVSSASGSPWVSIAINDAALSCQGLSLKHDLISNQEWMAIARMIEETSSNWDSSIIGSGSLFTGHNDNNPSSVVGISDEDIQYTDTNNVAPSLQRRTLTLPNNQLVWDMSGNVHEWVDWDGDSLGVQGYYKNNFCDLMFEELPGISCLGFDLLFNEYSPMDDLLNSANGVGKFKGPANGVSDPVAKRGGSYNSAIDSGIFSLTFENDRSDISANIGFRCVIRK